MLELFNAANSFPLQFGVRHPDKEFNGSSSIVQLRHCFLLGSNVCLDACDTTHDLCCARLVIPEAGSTCAGSSASQADKVRIRVTHTLKLACAAVQDRSCFFSGCGGCSSKVNNARVTSCFIWSISWLKSS